MKRRFHWMLWLGLFLVLAGLFSFPLLAEISFARDFAWPNFLLLLAGVILIGVSFAKARREPAVYRGKVLAGVLGGLSAAALGFFAFGIFFLARVPLSQGVPNVGQKAPDFTLPDQNGQMVSLKDLISSSGAGSSTAGKGALLIFYRGHW